jgi:simple sugar transport system ATP-binding protein
MAYIELRNITKTFGAVRANDGIDLDIHKGEIHALLGENGSGKTTLMNILSGSYKSDAGSVTIDGKQRRFKDPRDAIKAGVGMIHQHADLVDSLSVTENVAAGMGGGIFLDNRRVNRLILDVADRYGLSIDPARKPYELSIGEKQTVEMVKTLSRGVATLILDEPTAVLTPFETKRFFENLREIRAHGGAIVLITHKLQEVFDVSDRVTVLRKGRAVFSSPIADADRAILMEKMIGHAPANREKGAARASERPEPILSVRALSVAGRHGLDALREVSLDVFPGEIHGIAGVVGNGQKELCDALAGVGKIRSGAILFRGADISSIPIAKRKEKGVHIGYVPEDRMDSGLVGAMRISENLMLRRIDDAGRIFYDEKAARDRALDIIRRYRIDAVGPNQPVKELSGGNIQKVLLGREIEEEPALLVMAYPVRGLDIGATDYILDLLAGKRAEGATVVMVGEDIDILLDVCDRISVMFLGRIVATLDAASTSKSEIGALMTGADAGGRI